MRLELWPFSNTQVVVYKATRSGMESVRSFADENGFVVVDARRRWREAVFGLFCAGMFVFADYWWSWFWLLMALDYGRDWVKTFPRQEMS